MDSESIFDVDNQITQAGLSATIQLESDKKLDDFSNPFATTSNSKSARRSSTFNSNESFLLDKPQTSFQFGQS